MATVLKIDPEDVLWAEAIGNYVSIHTENDRFTVNISLKELLRMLGSGFVQVSRAFLVSLDKISSLNANTLVIKNTLIPVKDAYRKALISLR